jgi:hypothetical protein
MIAQFSELGADHRQHITLPTEEMPLVFGVSSGAEHEMERDLSDLIKFGWGAAQESDHSVSCYGKQAH